MTDLVTIGGREWLVAVAPVGDGLVMEILRYADELRDPADFFTEVPKTKPQKDLVELAVQLIEQKSAPFKPEAYRDHYQEALKALVQEKMKGRKIVAQDEGQRPTGTNVVDLMEALKRSVVQSTTLGAKRASPRAVSETTPKTAKTAPKKRRSS